MDSFRVGFEKTAFFGVAAKAGGKILSGIGTLTGKGLSRLGTTFRKHPVGAGLGTVFGGMEVIDVAGKTMASANRPPAPTMMR